MDTTTTTPTDPLSATPNVRKVDDSFALEVDHLTKQYGDHTVVDDRTLRDLLRNHAAAGGTVFVSSHLLAEVEHLADDVVVINEGRLVTTGALAELQQTTSLVRSSDRERLALVLEQAGATTQPEASDGLVVRGMPIDGIGDRAFAAGIAVHELSPHAGSLEELFLNWTTNPSSAEDDIQL